MIDALISFVGYARQDKEGKREKTMFSPLLKLALIGVTAGMLLSAFVVFGF